MTPRQARVALGMFLLLAAGITYNALYMQRDAALNRRAEREAAPPSQRAETSPGRSRAGQGANRTASIKTGSVHMPQARGGSPGDAGTDTIGAIQRELNRRGFGPVPTDGTMQPITRAAIISYEHDQRLPLTGEATEALLARLVLGAPAADASSGAGRVQSAHAAATIKEVQRLLAARGYRPGRADGRVGAETAAAIRAFEKDQGLTPKGRISAEVFARLDAGTAPMQSAEAR